MLIQSQGALVYEIMQIKNAVKNQDPVLLQKYFQQYEEKLSVPKRGVFRTGFLTLCSEEISYHLLSIYLLLDLIEFFWNGKKFTDSTLTKNNTPLLEPLSLNQKGVFGNTDSLKKSFERIGKGCPTPLHVFLLPYQSADDYILEFTYPGNILIIFGDEKKDEEKLAMKVYKGIAEFYLKKHLKEFRPNWAKNDEQFYREFILWCEGKSSKFM